MTIMKTHTAKTQVLRIGEQNRLFQITNWPRLFPIAQYVVRDDEGFTLIDTGIGRQALGVIEDLVEEFQQPVRRIVLTHAHIDHIGGLDAHAAAFPDAEVAASARAADFMRGDLNLLPAEAAISATLPGNFPAVDTQPTRILTPGEQIGPLLVVDAAGHTPDSISFLDTVDGTLLVGDAFQTQGDVAVAGVVVPTFPVPGRATWHRPMALQAARRMLALRPQRLASGHGPVIEQPGPAIQQAIDHAARQFADQQGGGVYEPGD